MQVEEKQNKEEIKQETNEPSENKESIEDVASTKEEQTKPVEQEKPKLTKADRERIYKIPTSPHLIIHPTPTAKYAKFDCQLVSLSHLLDYRKEDNKESSFEVSLFAEYFNEMLIRDYGFLIYKHLLGMREEKEKDSSNTPSSKRKLSVSNDGKEDDSTSDSKKIKTTNTNDQPGSNSSNTTPSKDVNKEGKDATPAQTPKPKPKTIYPELLLGFIYLDTNRTNYIYEKDFEDLLLCLGLSLTRSKVRAILKKIKFRDGLFNYRTLTDKTVPANSTIMAIRNSVSAYKLPTDDQIVSNIVEYDSYIKRIASNESQKSETDDSKNLVVEINGNAVDVLSTLKKLEVSEENAIKLDQKLKESLDEMGMCV